MPDAWADAERAASSLCPPDRHDCFPLRVTLSAPQPRFQIHNARIRPQPEPLREPDGRDQFNMPACHARDPHQIGRPEIADACCIQGYDRHLRT